MRRTNRYPTRSTTNRSGNGAVANINSSTTSVVSERRSERSRSQTERQGISSSQSSSHDYHQRIHHQHNQHHHQQQQQHPSIPPYHPSIYRTQSSAHMSMGNGHITIPSIQMNSHSLSSQPPLYRPPPNYPSFSMPIINETTLRKPEVKLIKLNSYDDEKVLIKTRSTSMYFD